MTSEHADMALAQRVYARARPEARFVLRSGQTSTEYFDEHLFEGDPHLLRAVGSPPRRAQRGGEPTARHSRRRTQHRRRNHHRGAIITAASELRARGAEIDAAVCVIDRESGGAESLAAAGIELCAAFKMSDLLAAANI